MKQNKIQEHLNLLSGMSSRNYHKCLMEDYSNHRFNNPFMSYDEQFYNPDDPNDYLYLKPKLLLCDTKAARTKFLNAFYSISSFTAPETIIGRQLWYLVIDERNHKLLGFIRLASDFFHLAPRDKWIGWKTDRGKNGKLQHTCILNICVATQPFGHDYVGGKLLSLLSVSDVVEKEWNNRYEETLVGVTTTSLFGGFSQYNGLKYWRKCGTTEGQIPVLPTETVYKEIREWVKCEYPDDFSRLNNISRPRYNLLMFAYKKLGVNPPCGKLQRGVYFCSLYENTREFLRGEKELGNKKFDNNVDSLIELWRWRYAKKRVENLQKRVITQTEVNETR